MSRPPVHGAVIDDQTRCVHWHSPLDVIAIRFVCCDRFYPCDSCHAEAADHQSVPWPRDRRDEAVVLCGACDALLTVSDYLASGDHCPSCGTGFNPGCRLHHDRYFERD